MRLGKADQWLDLQIVGFESAPTEVDETYDVETEWLVLRADAESDAGFQHFAGVSVDVEEAGHFVAWLKAVATDTLGPSDAWRGSGEVRFAEPDMAVQFIGRVGDRITLRWRFAPSTLVGPVPDDLVLAAYRGSPVISIDAAASPAEVESAADDLHAVLQSLVEQRHL